MLSIIHCFLKIKYKKKSINFIKNYRNILFVKSNLINILIDLSDFNAEIV